MHSWKRDGAAARDGEPAEDARLPGRHGAQRCSLRWATTRPRIGCCRTGMTGRIASCSTRRYRKVDRALRPWTIDFHVAQNDATVKGSGSHDKTGRHCLPDDPNGKLDIVASRRLLDARRRRASRRSASSTSAGTAACSPTRRCCSSRHLERRARADDRGRNAHGWDDATMSRCAVRRRDGKEDHSISAWSVTGSWDARIPMRFCRHRASSTCRYKPVLKAVARAQQGSRAGVRRQLGLRVGRDRLARAGRPHGHRSHRHREPERHARRTSPSRPRAPARW